MADEAQTGYWWLEAAQIGIPALVSVIVGWFIVRKNEKFKNELARGFTHYQTRLTSQHEARLAAINKMSPVIESMRRLLTASRVRDMNLPFMVDVNRTEMEDLIREGEKLKGIIGESGVYFDKSIVMLVGQAYSYSLLFAMIDKTFLDARRGGEDAELHTNHCNQRATVESVLNQLDDVCRKIVSPES